MTIILMSCEGTDEIFIEIEPEDLTTCENSVATKGLYYEINGDSYLWGGEDSSTHFRVNNLTLNVCHLKKGLGRETLYAPVDPEYELLKSSATNYPDSTFAVIIDYNGTVKVFPYQVLRRYETVNEYINGDPVAIVYCFLADLSAVYSRKYCGSTLTFAVSGFTYKDPNAYEGKESFVLWDRNSESLWWPINDRGVSGVFVDEPLVKYQLSKWGVSTFGEIRSRYPDAVVLKASQSVKTVGSIRKASGC